MTKPKVVLKINEPISWDELRILAAEAVEHPASAKIRDEYRVSANPEVILRLLDERDELAEELAVLGTVRAAGCACSDDEACKFVRERDELQEKQAEYEKRIPLWHKRIEELEADSERMRRVLFATASKLNGLGNDMATAGIGGA